VATAIKEGMLADIGEILGMLARDGALDLDDVGEWGGRPGKKARRRDRAGAGPLPG
jgi:hypothetical protein